MVTVFGAPAPLRVGVADLSVMVQGAADQNSVLDAKVRLHLKRSSATNVFEIVVPASHAAATNKLLYAAHVNLPSAGKWNLEVGVTRGDLAASASGDINVLPPEPPLASHWLYIALVPLLIVLFAANQWLKRNRRFRRFRVRP